MFNKPTKIGGTTFQYGPGHQRLKQIDGDRTVYYFNGGQYKEIETDAGTITRNTVGGYYWPGRGDGTAPEPGLMFVPATGARIWLCTEPTDMRKSFAGLSALVKHRLLRNPLNGDYFVFVNRRATLMKV